MACYLFVWTQAFLLMVTEPDQTYYRTLVVLSCEYVLGRSADKTKIQ
jgi:hypothetical protein